mgnify:CR=1 FL=1
MYGDEKRMRKKSIAVMVLGVLLITIMPPLAAENPYGQDILFSHDPPFWEGSVTLIRNATFEVIAHHSGKIYKVSSTTALGALNSASKLGNFDYTIDDQWYDQFGSLLVDTIAGKQGEGFDGWQYWVNYPDELIPYVGADQYQVREGDVVDFFYGGFGINPDSSSMLLRIHIQIRDDDSPPIVDIARPIGGIYILDREIIALPVDFAIILGKITLVAEVFDELTCVDRVEFFVDNHRYVIDEEYPYEWTWDETNIGRHTLHIVAYDEVGNHDYDERILWTLLV